ncbi:MAG TPA: hypothetical protein VE442_05635 [Jatrophihabitans sp.]|nr:hypothetical protein [Jatrophihabitans sp.]
MHDAAGQTVDAENSARSYAAGHRYHEDWLRGPLGPDSQRIAAGPVGCSACRRTGDLSIELAPVADTTFDHYGFLPDSRHLHDTAVDDSARVPADRP